MAVFRAVGLFIGQHWVILGALLLAWNLVVMFTYAADKRKARKGAWRIPEATLLTMAWAFGGLGAVLGMYLFRHKTKHIRFILLVPGAFMVQWALLLASLIVAYLV